MEKRILLALIVFILVAFSFMISPLKISAMLTDEMETKKSDEELVEDEGDASVASSGEGLGHPDNHGELWYILSYDAPTFGNQTVEIDYNQKSELLTYLKPGDIIYETNDSIIGDVTGHIAIVYDILWDEEHQQYYVSIIEAYTGGVGYSIMTPNRFEEKEAIIYRLKDASETQIQNALTWLTSRCGDNFEFHPKKYLNGLKKEDGKTYWYCAELIWAAFMSPENDDQKIGLDWDDNTDGGNLISPHALALSPHLTTILHYEKETVLSVVDDAYHTYTCDGDTYTEEHDYEEYNHCYEKCRACGYTRQAKSHEYEEYNCCYEKCSGCGDVIQAKSHVYTSRYSAKDATYHYAYCECGASSTQEHDYYESGEYKICEDCRYMIETEHEHTYTYRPSIEGKTHLKSCYCGYSAIEACFGAAIIGEAAYCAKCGQEINTSTGLLSLDNEPALLPSDDEDYLE